MKSSRTTRREFIGTSVGLAGAGWTAACSAAERKEALPTKAKGEGEGGMKLSLSVRVAEAFGSKEHSSMTIEQLIGLARQNGYQALCMRASQAGIHSTPEHIRQTRLQIKQAGLDVSMVTGDFAVPRNDEHGPDGLRNITPYLDLDPYLLQAHYYHGLASINLNRVELAQESFQKVRDAYRGDDFPYASYMLGYILAQKGEFESAASHLRHFLKISKKAPEAGQVKSYLAQWEKEGRISRKS